MLRRDRFHCPHMNIEIASLNIEIASLSRADYAKVEG